MLAMLAEMDIEAGEETIPYHLLFLMPDHRLRLPRLAARADRRGDPRRDGVDGPDHVQPLPARTDRGSRARGDPPDAGARRRHGVARAPSCGGAGRAPGDGRPSGGMLDRERNFFRRPPRHPDAGHDRPRTPRADEPEIASRRRARTSRWRCDSSTACRCSPPAPGPRPARRRRGPPGGADPAELFVRSWAPTGPSARRATGRSSAPATGSCWPTRRGSGWRSTRWSRTPSTSPPRADASRSPG